MNRYSAQKQYWKAKQTKQDKDKIADVVLLQKLQVSRSRGPRAGSAHKLAVPMSWVGDAIQTSGAAGLGWEGISSCVFLRVPCPAIAVSPS